MGTASHACTVVTYSSPAWCVSPVRTQVITYAQMEHLKDLAMSMPNSIAVRKKACITRLLWEDGSAIICIKYEHASQTTTAHGPIILTTGSYAPDFT